MNLSFKKNIFASLIHGFRPVSNEGLHTSRILFEKNYYDVLKLKKECSPKDIRESFIDLAKKFHPDTNNNDPESHTRFIELQKAYSVLSTPSKRQEYDSGQFADYQSNPLRRKQRTTTDSKDYKRHFDEEYQEFFYRSQQNTDPHPPSRVGGLQVACLLVAFTAVGAILQYFVLKQNDEQSVSKPSQVSNPDPHSNRPFFMRWIYRRSHREEMEKSKRASAAYYALKQEMDKRSEEYDIQKLRAAYFKEINGIIGLHLIPSLIRPKLPPPHLKDKLPTEEKEKRV